MKLIYILLILMGSIHANKDNTTFITQEQYGEKLYKNPRNIGCIQCHGERGSGGEISQIRQKNKIKPITSPKITGTTFSKFENALKNPKGLMPRYDLSAEEMLAIYVYLNPDRIHR